MEPKIGMHHMKFIQCDHCVDSRPRTDQTRGKSRKKTKQEKLGSGCFCWVIWRWGRQAPCAIELLRFYNFRLISSCCCYCHYGAKIDPSWSYLPNLWKMFSQSRYSCNSSLTLLELVLQLSLVPVLDVGAPSDGLISTASSVQQPTTSLVPCRKHCTFINCWFHSGKHIFYQCIPNPHQLPFAMSWMSSN